MFDFSGALPGTQQTYLDLFRSEQRFIGEQPVPAAFIRDVGAARGDMSSAMKGDRGCFNGWNTASCAAVLLTSRSHRSLVRKRRERRDDDPQSQPRAGEAKRELVSGVTAGRARVPDDHARVAGASRSSTRSGRHAGRGAFAVVRKTVAHAGGIDAIPPAVPVDLQAHYDNYAAGVQG